MTNVCPTWDKDLHYEKQGLESLVEGWRGTPSGPAGFGLRLIARVVAQNDVAPGLVRHAQFALDDIVRDYGPLHARAQRNLRLVFLEFAPAYDQIPTLDLKRVPAFLVAIPLHERAITESDRAIAGDPADLIARPPEGAVAEANAARVVRADANHRRVRAVK